MCLPCNFIYIKKYEHDFFFFFLTLSYLECSLYLPFYDQASNQDMVSEYT